MSVLFKFNEICVWSHKFNLLIIMFNFDRVEAMTILIKTLFITTLLITDLLMTSLLTVDKNIYVMLNLLVF